MNNTDDLDELFDDDEYDYDDIDEEDTYMDAFSDDLLDETDYEDELRDLIEHMVDESGLEFNETDDIVDDTYYHCKDYFEVLLNDYGDLDESLEDEDLLESINDYLESNAIQEESASEPSEDMIGTRSEDNRFSDDRSEMQEDEDINIFLGKDLKISRPSFFLDGYDVSEDSKGHNIGYKRKSFINDDVTKHYDEKGEYTGYSRKSYLNDAYTNYYDSKGHKIGYSRKSLLNDSYTKYYDNKGNFVGYSRKDLLFGNRQVYKKKK